MKFVRADGDFCVLPCYGDEPCIAFRKQVAAAIDEYGMPDLGELIADGAAVRLPISGGRSILMYMFQCHCLWRNNNGAWVRNLASDIEDACGYSIVGGQNFGDNRADRASYRIHPWRRAGLPRIDQLGISQVVSGGRSVYFWKREILREASRRIVRSRERCDLCGKIDSRKIRWLLREARCDRTTALNILKTTGRYDHQPCRRILERQAKERWQTKQKEKEQWQSLRSAKLTLYRLQKALRSNQPQEALESLRQEFATTKTSRRR